ncbi:hypothetical protein [Dyella telluris]|uniref:hypothetical protein n=1 Tax=Dyella telluris TaxID=2763498 RepID=UPI001EE54936|nr:hypothetical protein [Dyella telluris]
MIDINIQIVLGWPLPRWIRSIDGQPPEMGQDISNMLIPLASLVHWSSLEGPAGGRIASTPAKGACHMGQSCWIGHGDVRYELG